MRRSALAVAVTAAFLPTVAASIADATPMTPDNWTAPVALGVPGHVSQSPALSMGAGGDVTAAVKDATDGRLVVQSHPAGGVWSTPVALSAAGFKVLNDFKVVTSPADDAAIAVWAQYTENPFPAPPSPYQAFVASRTAGGAWGTPVALSPDGVYGTVPAVALGADGRAVATWYQSDDTALHAAIRDADGSWGAPLVVASTDGDGVDQNKLVLRPDGSAVAVWQQSGVLKSAVLRGSTWSSVTDLGRGGGFALAPDTDGAAALTYVDVPTTGQFVRSLDADDAWGAPEKLSDDGALNYYEAALDIAPDGSAVAAWPQADTGGAGNQMHVARRDADGTWHSAETLGKSVSDPAGAAAGTGGMSVVGFQSGNTGIPFMAALATPGSPFSTPSSISGADAAGGHVGVGGDGRGSAAAVYLDSINDVVAATFQDRSGPDLRKVKVPAHAVAGREVSTFSVSPVDAFDSVALTTWDFGDGTAPVSGEHPSHTYAEAGTYTVGVSSKDTLGWSTTKLSTITVDPAAPDGGGGDGGSGGDNGGGTPGGDGGGTPGGSDDGGPTKTVVTPAPVADPVPGPPAPPAPPAGDQAKPTAPALAAPTVMLAHRQKLATILSRRAIRTTVLAPAAGTLKVTATVSGADAKRLGLKSTRLAVTTTKVKAKSDAKVSLKLSAAVRKRAAKLRTLTVTLTVVFTSTDGHTTTTKTKLATRA